MQAQQTALTASACSLNADNYSGSWLPSVSGRGTQHVSGVKGKGKVKLKAELLLRGSVQP